MIDKKISMSEQVAELPERAQLIFTWSIAHADDVGLLPYSMKSLRGLIVPMMELTTDEFTKHWDAIKAPGLVVEFEYEGVKYWKISKFFKYQRLRRDFQPDTLLRITIEKNPQKSWEKLLAIEGLEDTPMETEQVRTGGGTITERPRTGSVPATATEVKRSEVKRSKIYAQNKFEQFWSEYPNKKSKKKAQLIWERIKLTEELFKQIMDGLARAKTSAQWRKDGGQFIPHPTTWLNGERWSDEVSAEVAVRKSVKI